MKQFRNPKRFPRFESLMRFLRLKDAALCLVLAAALTLMSCSRVAISKTDDRRIDPKAGDALVGLLLFGSAGQIDVKAYPAGVQSELKGYLQRYKSSSSADSVPAKRRREGKQVYAARDGYVRRLAAASADPRAPALAKAYVNDLRPCSAWEGLHDCPEREAGFAFRYLKANPGGPFGDYLRLLAAHRWLCAAEAYELEKQPEGAARNRRAYEEAIGFAQKSSSPMIAMAAERLWERNSCLAKE